MVNRTHLQLSLILEVVTLNSEMLCDIPASQSYLSMNYGPSVTMLPHKADKIPELFLEFCFPAENIEVNSNPSTHLLQPRALPL